MIASYIFGREIAAYIYASGWVERKLILQLALHNITSTSPKKILHEQNGKKKSIIPFLITL